MPQTSQETVSVTPGSRRSSPQAFWTNPSVNNFTKGEDPVEVVTQKARNLVFKAMEEGWQGPPFDPFWLAEFRKIPVTPRDDIPDARLIPESSGNVRIEFNPNQPRARVRFSVAHEIAHTLFPDYYSSVRNRSTAIGRPDEWQLELLCNIAAAEILIPPIPTLSLALSELTIDNLRSMWKQFDVSPEAFLLRIVKMTNQPISVFAAARAGDDLNSGFRVDYCIPSSSSVISLPLGMRISNKSVLSECTAIGYTAQREETWFEDTRIMVECVAVPPYPGHSFPRVIGVLRRIKDKDVQALNIQSVYGDVTEPRGDGPKIVAHIVNDRTPSWGAGAARAIAMRWPSVQDDFRKWTLNERRQFRLGSLHESPVSADLTVVSMVAQHGFGVSANPRIRYDALTRCLSDLALVAKRKQASVHMPKIGTGFAGGSWDVVEELVRQHLIGKGINVVVYILPRSQSISPQTSIRSFSSKRP